MKKISLVLVLFFLSLTTLFSQSNELNPRYGLYGHLGMNLHSADFKKIPECPNCSPGFESGFGIGPSFGLLFEYPIMNKTLLSLRAGYNNFSSKLSRTEPVGIILDGKEADGEFEHTLDATLSQISFEPMLSYNISGDLFLSGGFLLGFGASGSYDQKEEVSKPANTGTFMKDGVDTESRTRNEHQGDFEYLNSFNYGLMIGASYELPLNADRTLIFAPEIYFNFALSDVLDANNAGEDYGSWKANALRGGVAIKYSPSTKEIEEIFEQEYKIDTVKVPTPKIAEAKFKEGTPKFDESKVKQDNKIIITELVTRVDTIFTPIEYNITAKINAVGVDKDNNEVQNPTFVIEEFTSRNLQPLLNYVFFDENSSELAARYIKLDSDDAGDFNENELYHNGTLSNYYNILNIIGSRLRANHDANIEIVGCNSGVGQEKNNKKLSENRAVVVKEYLVRVWAIDDNRIKIKVMNLPKKASTPLDEAEKAAENRRVELYSNNSKPLYLNDTIRTANPPIVRFYPEVESDLDIKKWTINVYQNNHLLKSFENTKEVTQVNWMLEEDQQAIPKLEVPVYYEITAIDVNDNEAKSDQKSFTVQQQTISKKRSQQIGDKTIDKYSLILFDFDKATIDGNNKQIVGLINKNLAENSVIKVYGYTDKTGNDDHNLKLSERRALKATKSLQFDAIDVKGLGETVILYDNELPEGRFYCRTVEIIVETPIEK
jgi:outer membrane protein OmpA-like peptidoglycan-associated protein